MKSKLEIEFQQEVRKSFLLLYPNCFFHKINDMPRFEDSKFIKQKPFDIICANWHSAYAIETKVHKKDTAWPLSRISENQFEQLGKCSNTIIFPGVLVLVRYQKNGEKINFCKWISYQDLVIYKQDGIKSIKIIDLMVGRIERVKYNNETIWDLRKIIQE